MPTRAGTTMTEGASREAAADSVTGFGSVATARVADCDVAATVTAVVTAVADGDF
ncbi:hypothetical protein [Mycolicibacterium rhodesiae]|uniref:hypothetical protein n=1 Tax=Mycolicibacterium rhodesiae TaxID=36814 RepID=UPI0013FE2CE2|nr:hypothetical protein [Mycolicibacterium rhodesiae]MCV7347840.1 hypothetical protein [Mycolicibacterium rhodesiae]